LTNRKREISVVITCSKEYHQYLPTLLASINQQTVPPDEIIIVYDDTEPSITSVPYLQVKNYNPLRSRKDGFLATSKEVVCFLDADDYISNDYLAAGLAVKTDNNIVYSDMQQFGNSHKLLRYHPKPMSQENYIHIGALVSRSSIRISEAFKSCPINCHEDWVFWRRLIKAGCPTTKQTGIYYNRRHAANRSLEIDKLPFHKAKGVQYDTIKTIKFKSIVKVNRIINSTSADYLLFYDDYQDVLVDNFISKLQYGVAIVQLRDRELWSGTLVVVDLLRPQTPFYKPVGTQILI